MYNPKEGTDTPITLRQIHTISSGYVDYHAQGSNAFLNIIKNDELVQVKLKVSTKRFHRNNFARVRQDADKQGLDDNDISTLRDASKINAFFREIEQKTPLDIEWDRTVRNETEGAVAGGGDDDDEEINFRCVSNAANFFHTRDKSSEN